MEDFETVLSKIQEIAKEMFTGKYETIEIHKDCTVYLIPTGNPDVFTIRYDIRVNRGEK